MGLWYFLREINDIIVKFLIDVVCVLFNIYFVILKGYFCGKFDWCNVDRVGVEFECNYNVKV